MASELQYQTHLVKACKGVGGFAFKLSNRFLGGIPDLFLQMPNFPSLMVEVKLWKTLPKPGSNRPIANGLTALQKQTLMQMHLAGSHCGWLAICQEGTSEYIYTCQDPNHNPTVEEFRAKSVERKRGKSWPVILPQILAPLYRGS